ncbi:MAG: SpoIID/LytB domain-containing protein, partial [Bacteroidales bacterium]|nr:SpoIID/LytB domain-containing protein [Bacteroidales bacterium]
GRTELFSTCWEDKDLPYLQSLPDTPGHEEGADPFCNTADAAVLSQVLNDYDLETKDFFSWKAEYSRAEISELISRRSGRMIGELKELKPLETGPSGRIKKLEVVGTAGSFVVGKELMVRKILSESHLKSSAFSIVWTKDDRLVLEGRGWGHGVGLCQIGAAVMASRGYGYDEILQHYYPGTSLERL